jgi:hypothetical protein
MKKIFLLLLLLASPVFASNSAYIIPSGPQGPQGAAANKFYSITFTGLGNVVATNTQALLAYVPATGTITSIVITATPTGSAVIDIWRAAGAQPTSSAQSIVGSGNFPTLTSGTISTTTPSGWTSTTLNLGDCLLFNVNSCTNCTYINIVINYQ